MGLFNKIFGTKSKLSNPDNTLLLALLEKYREENGKGDTYKNVVLELMNGNSFLMIPSENDTSSPDPDKWTTLEKDSTLKLASVVNLDGLKVLGVFTDEKALINWTKKESQYTALRSKDVLNFVQENGMDRIVINSDQPNMFVLERSRENIKEHKIQQDTQVQIGTPSSPLSISITRKLIENFRKDSTISEVYQYGQAKGGEFSIVLGFKLASYSENAKKAAINAVQNSLQNEKLDQLLDLFFIETEDWYERIIKIENSLLYKK